MKLKNTEPEGWLRPLVVAYVDAHRAAFDAARSDESVAAARLLDVRAQARRELESGILRCLGRNLSVDVLAVTQTLVERERARRDR